MESKYAKLYRTLAEQIRDKELKPGDKLPPEGELMETYGVSRDTVRKALNLLVQDGFIQKGRGRAAVVVEKRQVNFPVSEITSFKEISGMSALKTVTYVEDLEIIKNQPEVMQALNLQKEEEACYVLRVREIDGEKIILDIDYFARAVVENIPLKAARESIYEYLEQTLGLHIGYAMKEITTQKATERDHRLLDMHSYDMVVVVKSYTYLEDGTLFQYTESRHRPDKFRFVDFAHRKEKNEGIC